MQAIFERRSIRKYTDKPVPKDLIEQIVRAGMAAPSAGNEQPWHFIIIEDKTILDNITKVHPYSQMLKEVNHAIVVCGDLALQKYEGFWVQDCSAATQNMLIMARDLGLGSVWVGVYPLEDRVRAIKELLHLPESVIPLCILPLGYPGEEKGPVDRFNASRLHWNQW